MFESSRIHGLFTAYFDEELYRYAAKYYETHVFNRNNYLVAIVGVTRALEDVEISQRNRPLYQDAKHFLEQDFCKTNDDNNAAQILDKFKRYFTARVDLKFKAAQGDFKIVSVSDSKATVWKPAWFNKDGIGYQIQSYASNMTIAAKATSDGQINLNLRGLSIKDAKDESKRVPYWIDYTKLSVNDKVIFDKLTPVWHDKPYIYTVDAKADEEIKIRVEWLPHRSDV